MRLGPKPDTVIEWLILKLNLAPKPLADTQLAFQLARIIMAATKVRLFDALRQGGRTAVEVAIDRGTNQTALQRYWMLYWPTVMSAFVTGVTSLTSYLANGCWMAAPTL
jgi:hypothetical protein